MRSLTRALRALWWRRGVSAALVVVAALSTAAAVVAPLYVRSAGASALSETLAHEPAVRTGITVSRDVTDEPASAASLDHAVPRRPPLGYPTRVRALATDAELKLIGRPAARGGQTTVMWRAGACMHLRLLSGRCPARAGEVLVGAASGRRLGWQLGDLLGLPRSGRASAPLQVVGTYVPREPDAGYWLGVDFHPVDTLASTDVAAVEPSFVAAATLDRTWIVASGSSLTAQLLLPFDRRGVTVDTTTAYRNAVVGTLNAAAAAEPQVTATTSALDVLAGVERNQRTLLTLVLLVAVQLTALTWFVLYLVVSAVSDARGNEVALAKMHGLGWVRTAGFGVLEPLLLLLLGAPVGLLLAMAATARLVPGVPVAVRWPALAAGAVALAGAVAAVLLGTRRTLTRPVLEQWRRSGDDRAGSRAFSAGDGVVVALAVAGLYELHSGSGLRADQHDAVSLLGPALLTLVIATLGVRLLPLACRLAIRRTRTSPRVGGFVAVRQVARRPAGLRLVALLAVAVSLTLFAVYAVNVADHNRLLRARTEVGADRVLTVAPGPADLQAVVRRLDPGGRAAMAVARVPDTSTGRGSVLAVDTSRLAAVANWPAGPAAVGAPSVARRLSVPTPPPLVINATGLRLRVTPDATAPADAQPLVALHLRDAGGNEVAVALGQLRSNVASYSAAVTGCAAGCRLTGITLSPGPLRFPDPLRTSFLGLDERSGAGRWVSLPVGFSVPGRWNLGPDAFTASGTGLSVFLGQLQLQLAAGPPGAPPLLLQYADRVAPLPTLPTRRALGPPPYSSGVTGLDNTGLPATRIGIADVLPGVGTAGTLVDLTSAQRRVTLPGQAALATYQVWLSATAPADFGRRLAAAGIAVLHTDSVAGRQASLGRQGPALALRLFLVAALAATVLAAGATAIATYLGARRRAFELAALTALGFGRGTLLRACLAEQGLLLGSGLALGVLAGGVGGRLALPSIPLYVDASPLRTVLTPNLLLLAGVVLALGAALAVTAVVSSLLLVRSAHPDRLREAAP